MPVPGTRNAQQSKPVFGLAYIACYAVLFMKCSIACLTFFISSAERPLSAPPKRVVKTTRRGCTFLFRDFPKILVQVVGIPDFCARMPSGLQFLRRQTI